MRQYWIISWSDGWIWQNWPIKTYQTYWFPKTLERIGMNSFREIKIVRRSSENEAFKVRLYWNLKKCLRNLPKVRENHSKPDIWFEGFSLSDSSKIPFLRGVMDTLSIGKPRSGIGWLWSDPFQYLSHWWNSWASVLWNQCRQTPLLSSIVTNSIEALLCHRQ